MVFLFLNILYFVNIFLGFPICFLNFLLLYSLHPHFLGMLSILSQNIFSQFLAPFIIYLLVHNYANIFFKNYIMAPKVSAFFFHIFLGNNYSIFLVLSCSMYLLRLSCSYCYQKYHNTTN